jgi:hypothetical protein
MNFATCRHFIDTLPVIRAGDRSLTSSIRSHYKIAEAKDVLLGRSGPSWPGNPAASKARSDWEVFDNIDEDFTRRLSRMAGVAMI